MTELTLKLTISPLEMSVEILHDSNLELCLALYFSLKIQTYHENINLPWESGKPKLYRHPDGLFPRPTWKECRLVEMVCVRMET